MPTTDEAVDISMFDDTNRPFLLAAQKYRAKLQQSDTEDLFSIARRLRTQFEAKKAADAADAKKPATDTALFDAGAHRPGFRDGTQWRHDRRKRRTTEEYDPEDDPTKSEEALSDARRKKQYYNAAGQEEGSSVEEEPERDDVRDAQAEYLDRLENSWKTCGR